MEEFGSRMAYMGVRYAGSGYGCGERLGDTRAEGGYVHDVRLSV
jgi:hypothetical protein